MDGKTDVLKIGTIVTFFQSFSGKIKTIGNLYPF